MSQRLRAWNTAGAAAAADPREQQGGCQQEINAIMGRNSESRPPIQNKPQEDKEMTAWIANRDKEEKLRIVSERTARLTEHPEEPNPGFNQYTEERAHNVEGRRELSRYLIGVLRYRGREKGLQADDHGWFPWAVVQHNIRRFRPMTIGQLKEMIAENFDRTSPRYDLRSDGSNWFIRPVPDVERRVNKSNRYGDRCASFNSLAGCEKGMSCTKQHDTLSPASTRCFNCGAEGHRLAECSRPRGKGTTKGEKGKGKGPKGKS